jgi:hypothetical protein
MPNAKETEPAISCIAERSIRERSMIVSVILWDEQTIVGFRERIKRWDFTTGRRRKTTTSPR